MVTNSKMYLVSDCGVAQPVDPAFYRRTLIRIKIMSKMDIGRADAAVDRSPARH